MSPILDRTTLDQMFATALKIIDRTGLHVDYPEIVAKISGRRGFTLMNGRVHVSPDRVLEWHANYQKRNAVENKPAFEKQNGPNYFTSDRSTLIVDWDGVTIRPMLRKDVIEGTKLIQTLGKRNVIGGVAGVPCDVPYELQALEQYLIGAQYSAFGGSTSWVTDIPTAQIIREMDKVYGRPFNQWVWCASPLVLGGPELRILWHFRDEVTHVWIGTMPFMGLSGPCDPIAVFTLSIAECIGGAAILYELMPEVAIDIRPHPVPVNLRNGLTSVGTPEWQILDVMHNEVYRYLGGRYPVKHLLTNAYTPDLQCQMERMTGALLGVLNGYEGYEGLGQIGVDMIWSPEQLLLDLDILGEALRIGAGAFSGTELELDHLADVVDEVIQSGSIFAEHETTIKNHRQQYQLPKILQRAVPYQDAISMKPDLLKEAQRQADILIASYNFEPPRDILRELTTIYERGKEYLQGNSPVSSL